MFTLQQYHRSECTHDEYYSQFVNQNVLRLVASKIGVSRIEKSLHLRFNDIPLQEWYDLRPQLSASIDKRLFMFAEHRTVFIFSLSDTACIAKAAAKLLKEGA